jgi:hypothetical protein
VFVKACGVFCFAYIFQAYDVEPAPLSVSCFFAALDRCFELHRTCKYISCVLQEVQFLPAIQILTIREALESDIRPLPNDAALRITILPFRDYMGLSLTAASFFTICAICEI